MGYYIDVPGREKNHYKQYAFWASQDLQRDLNLIHGIRCLNRPVPMADTIKLLLALGMRAYKEDKRFSAQLARYQEKQAAGTLSGAKTDNTPEARAKQLENLFLFLDD